MHVHVHYVLVMTNSETVACMSHELSLPLQGSVSIGGQSVRWLRDNLGFFKDAKEIGNILSVLPALVIGASQREQTSNSMHA